MADGPLISVVVPAYNRAQTIAAAVGSVLAQTWPNLEVIVVDDASNDATWETLQAIDDPRLRLIRCAENGGVSRARNIGIDAAQGDWIAFQDSDDEWHSTKLARQMAHMKAVTRPDGAPWGAVYSGMAILEEGAPAPTTLPRSVPAPDITAPLEGALLPTLVERSVISTQMLMVRANVLRALGGFDEDLKALVDWELVLRLATDHPIAYIDEVLVIQRFSENSITKNRSRRVASRAYILDKHAALFARFPRAAARQYMIQSGELRMLGRRAEARAALTLARQCTPGDVSLWLKTLRLALPVG